MLGEVQGGSGAWLDVSEEDDGTIVGRGKDAITRNSSLWCNTHVSTAWMI